MSEINFLSDKKKEPEAKPGSGSGREEFKWTNPLPAKSASRKNGRGKAGWSSFFKKDKGQGLADKNQPKGSRQEVLRLIEDYVKDKEGGEAGKSSEQEEVLEKTKTTESQMSTANQGAALINQEKEAEGERGSPLDILKKERQRERPAKRRGNIIATDLIRGEVLTFFNWRKNMIILFLAVILSILFISAIYGLLFLWKGQKLVEIREINQRFAELNLEINKAEKSLDKILVLQKKLGLVKNLINEHIYWTNFFKFLENNTLVDVYYSGFGGDVGGNYVLAASAKDFYTLAEQIKILRSNNKVLSVSTAGGQVVSAEKNEGRSQINFNINLTIDPKIFNE